MKKILIAVFCFLSLFSKAQVYQSMPQYGYSAHRMSFDSTLQIPTFCGVPTLKSNVLKFGAIAFDSCNNRFYFYNPKTAIWDTIKGGGSSTDTTSLSNRINLKVNISDTSAMLSKYLRKTDTTNKFVNNITRTLGKDSIIYFIGSTRYAIKDSVGTNPAPVGYYGAFQDNTIQTAAAINTPYAMKFGVTDLSNAVSIVSDGSNLTRITIANTGIYNIQFSAQFDRTNSGTDVIDIWLRKNGVDVAGTGGKIVLAGGATASAIIATWNYVLDVTAGDYYQLMWSTPDTHVRLLYESAQTSPFAHPLIPSTILTVTQQSGIMAGTGITAINSLTGAAQTMVIGTDSTDFKIVSTGTTHKFNLPTASATNRGALSSANWSTFNGKIGAGDTATMLTPYLRKVDTASLSSRIDLKVNISDTSSMLSKYLRKTDTASLSNRINLKVNISDTSSMLTKYINLAGTGLTKTSQTIANDLSVGVSGGQSIKSGTGASDTLRIFSTTNATKGKIIFGNSAYDEANNRLGINTTSPATPLEISGNTTATNSAQFGTLGFQSYALNNAWISDNIYFNGTNFIRRATGYGGLFYFQGQEGQFRFASTSTAGTTITNGSSGSGLVSLKTNLNGTFAVGDISAVSNTYTGAKFIVFGATGNVAIGTVTDNSYKLDVVGTARASQFQLSALNTAPASATATGVLGEIRIVNGFIYVCVATNTWQRAAITTW